MKPRWDITRLTGYLYYEAVLIITTVNLPARLVPALYYTAMMTLPSELTFVDSLTSAQRTRFYERHKPIAVVMILVVFLFPFVGLFVRGLFGVVLGVVLSVLAYYLTPYVVLTIFGGNRR